jgi:hypothetical protein
MGRLFLALRAVAYLLDTKIAAVKPLHHPKANPSSIEQALELEMPFNDGKTKIPLHAYKPRVK